MDVSNVGGEMRLLSSILPLMLELNMAASLEGRGYFEFKDDDSLSVYGVWANGERARRNSKNISYSIKSESLYIDGILLSHKLEAENHYLTIKFPDATKIKFQRDDF